MSDQTLTIRAATPDEVAALRRLAVLDSTRPLSGSVLLAEVEGVPLAAVSLETGATTADPFQYSTDAVRVLRARHDQLLRQGGDVAPGWSLLRRLVPSRLTAPSTRPTMSWKRVADRWSPAR
jgi:hypothetical protein